MSAFVRTALCFLWLHSAGSMPGNPPDDDDVALLQKGPRAHVATEMNMNHELGLHELGLPQDVIEQVPMLLWKRTVEKVRTFPGGIESKDILGIFMKVLAMIGDNKLYEALDSGVEEVFTVLSTMSQSLSTEAKTFRAAAGSAATADEAYDAFHDLVKLERHLMVSSFENLSESTLDLLQVMKPNIFTIIDLLCPIVNASTSDQCIEQCKSIIEGLPSRTQLHGYLSHTAPLSDQLVGPESFCDKVQKVWPGITQVDTAIQQQVIPTWEQVSGILTVLLPVAKAFLPLRNNGTKLTDLTLTIKGAADSFHTILSTASSLAEGKMGCQLEP